MPRPLFAFMELCACVCVCFWTGLCNFAFVAVDAAVCLSISKVIGIFVAAVVRDNRFSSIARSPIDRLSRLYLFVSVCIRVREIGEGFGVDKVKRF